METMDGTEVVRWPNGRSLAICQWGVPDGVPVFFLHGTLGGRLLRHAAGEYERHNLRVITYDRPGFGRSTRHQGRVVADGAADVALIADQLGVGRFGVVGVSGGGPYALAVAALLPERVTRCATIVTGAPLDAEGLDFFADMDPQRREDWQRIIAGGEAYLLEDYQHTLAWLDEFEVQGAADSSTEDHDLVVAAFRDALAAGPYGLVDDCLAELQPYGFNLCDVVAPTRMMLARDATSVPANYGRWLLAHLPNAELEWVEGGHFGPRDEQEEQLFAWAGQESET